MVKIILEYLTIVLVAQDEGTEEIKEASKPGDEQ